MAKLSVVVPFHNVADYIESALTSVARQTLRDLEVILVDDGSTDGSTVIAKGFAARDPRFRLIQQERTGLGLARNLGTRHASGEYLAFFDSDDLLDPHAYSLLVASLDKTGSDIASGGCVKFGREGLLRSWLHEEPFRETQLRTHVSRFPALLQDRTAWNKVFRRSFWDTHGLEFPGTLYEDTPVTLRAHVLASSVDVFKDVVYYWRIRDSATLSITQRSDELANIEQRMASMADVASFLAARAPALKPAFDATVLRGDMAMLILGFEYASEADRARIAEVGAGYLNEVDDSVYLRGMDDSIPAIRRLQYHLLRRGMLDELLEVLRYARRGDTLTSPVVRGTGREPRWYVSHPYFRDPARSIPDSVYDITSETTLNACLDAVTWHGKKLRLEGHAYIRRLSCATPSECEIQVTLRNSRTRRRIRLPVQRVRRPDVTERSGQAAVCYDWSGFVTEVHPRRLATLPGVWRGADWELRVRVSGGGLRREGPVSRVRPGSAQWPEGRWVAGDVWLQPAPENDTRFVIRGQQVTACVTACEADEGTLDVEGWASGPLAAGATLVIRHSKGGTPAVRIPAEPLTAGPGNRGDHRSRHGFRARIPVRRLASPGGTAGLIDRVVRAHDESTWTVSLSPGDGRPATRLAIAPATAGARVPYDAREITAFATHFGYLSLLGRSIRPVVTAVEWADDGTVTLRGDHSAPARMPSELILHHVSSGREHPLPVSPDENAFTVRFDPGRMPGLAGTLPLESGRWQLLMRAGGADIPAAAARRLLPHLPGYHRTGLHEMEAQPYHTDALRLHVRLALSADEFGRYARQQLQTRHYPRAAGQPLRDLAVFDSFSGKHYSCNPRAIYEELHRTHPEIECAWITRDGQFRVPDGARLIPLDSREHFDAMAQARYVITNNELPRWFRRRDGQFCLQTWHGTPLKRIGLDIERPQFRSALIYNDLLRESVANWSLLLSPNAFSTAIFRGAFGFGGEILESGYPRNDPLHAPDREHRAAIIRDRLGLPAGKRIVLYAPTWRDNTSASSGGYRFDLRLDLPAMAEDLGDDFLLLFRLHTMARGSVPGSLSSFVIDVTSYPDITDLYLISDILITDYSSVMFDFAGTGRPMIFFTPDLTMYRDELRGFYFDFAAEAPGPLLSTSDEVIDALRDIDGVAQSYKDPYMAFAGRYCALDDGCASARVVERLTAGDGCESPRGNAGTV